MTYPLGAVSGNNNLCISRTGNGQIQVDVANMTNRDIGFIGNVTGSASILLGTNSSNGTEYMFSGNGTKVDMHDASQGVSFWGSNLSVNVTDTDNESNIEWNASNSRLSTENTSRAIQLAVGTGASDNIFTMGWGDAQIIDGGDYNITKLGSGNSYYASTTDSKGALVFGGSGKATYHIGGNYGVFKQGTGFATYQINGELTDDKAYGFKNAILSGSSAAIVDNGARSLIVSTGLNSSVTANGDKSLYSVSNTSSPVVIGANSHRDYIFENGVTFKPDDGSGDGAIFLGQLLYQRGWSNINGVDESYNTNWYLGASGSNASNHITGSLVKDLLSGWLTLGDAGSKYEGIVTY